MKKILSLFFALLTVSVMNAKVAFLVPADNTNRDALRFEEVDGVEQSPERRAYDWFKTTFVDPGNGQFISLNDLGSLPADINAIWIYVDRVGFNAGDFDNLFNATVKANLQAFLNAGGNLFLGKQATRLEKDLVGATNANSDVITPNYADGGYRDAATWGVDYRFELDGAEWNNNDHRIFKTLPHKDGNYAELIWSDGRKITDNNCGIGIGDMGMGDNVKNKDGFEGFQSRNNCRVLGGWANGEGCHYGGMIEFYPTGARKGTVIMMGLAAYSWINNNAGNGWANTQTLTQNTLEYLDVVPNLAWNSETVQTSGVIGEDHYMTASATTGFTVRYAADHPEIANIGNEDGRVFYNYFGSTTFHATATGDGWNVPKATATIASGTITVNGGTEENPRFAYVLPYSLHTMANYDNEEGRRPDYEAAQWFHDQFISGNVGGEHGCFVRPSDLGSLNSAIKILWIHNDHVGKASDDYYNDLGGDTFRDNLAAFVNAGGNIFVSKQATRFVGDLGRNDYPSYNNGGYADRGPWRVGNKWNFEIGGEIDHSTHRVFSNMGTNTTIMAWGRHTDNNCIWQNFDGLPGSNDAGRINQYETDHNCVILGAWGHYNDAAAVSPLLECVGFVEYNPTAAGRGIIIAMGLGSYHWAEPTDEIKTLTRNTLSYLNFMNARPCAIDGTTPMETKLAENGFYPSNTTSFLTVHPVCENIAASYTLTDPNNIARIQEGVLVGENTITQLQFKAAGTVTLHITLTETRTDVNWPTGTYEYDREITFAYATENAAQAHINTYLESDFPDNGVTTENEVQMAMRLHPNVRGLDSVSYVIENHYDNTQGEAYKETKDGVTRLYFSKSGKVLLTINLRENNWVEAWPMGDYQFTRVVEFTYTQEKGPTFPWPAIFSAEAVPANRVIDLPETVEGLTVTYSIEEGDDATLEGHTLTLDDKASGHVTVHASVTEDKILVTWPVGTYNYKNSLSFQKFRPRALDNTTPMEEKLADDYFYPSNTTTFRTLHPVCEDMAAAYSIASDPNGIARIHEGKLQFKAAGTVTLHIVLTESRGDRLWEDGDYEYDREITFAYADAQAAQDGPNFTWPSQFETGAVGPNSVITLPATVAELPVSYEVIGDASLEGNEMTLANVESGSVTVNASVTETGFHEAWPAGVYNYQNSLTFHASEVAYLLPAAESIDHLAGWYDGEQPEYNAAKWFEETYIATGKGRFVTVNELPTLFTKGIKTLWVNIERIDITTENVLFAAMQEPLKTYIQAGGNVLLTKQATRLAYLMERIGYAPEFNADGYVTTNEDNIRSISTLMGTAGCVDERLDMSGHRIYNDMLSYFECKNMFFVGPDCKKTYNYCSWQDFMRSSDQDTHYDNCLIQRVRDFEQDWHATVFGIQGNIGDYCFSNIVEFNAYGDWQGRILTIGSAAYQWGTSNNGVERDNLKTLTANCLAYLANEDIPEEVYTRDITDGVYGTICWGYDVAAGKIEGAEIYELTSFNEAGDGVILTEVTSMVGGRPYFFLGTSSQLRLTYQGQKKEAAHYHGLVGYIPLTGSDPYHVEANAGKYILYYDKLMLVDSENVYVPVNRAYVDYSEIPGYDAGAPAGPRRRVVHIDRHQTPTGMEEVELPSKQGIYDILGRKVSNPQSAGFYIINGQKVVITH